MTYRLITGGRHTQCGDTREHAAYDAYQTHPRADRHRQRRSTACHFRLDVPEPRAAVSESATVENARGRPGAPVISRPTLTIGDRSLFARHQTNYRPRRTRCRMKVACGGVGWVCRNIPPWNSPSDISQWLPLVKHKRNLLALSLTLIFTLTLTLN